MSGYVSHPFPSLPNQDAFEIARPVRAIDRATLAQGTNHLLGHQMPIVHEMFWGGSESTTATYRFLTELHTNMKTLLWSFIHRGTDDSSAPHLGTITVPTARSTVYDVTERTVNITDLGDIRDHSAIFYSDIGSPDFVEFTYSVAKVRLHSVVVYQVPRSILTSAASQTYVDRTIADPEDFISDNAAAAVRSRSSRGEPALLNGIVAARDHMRRHWTPFMNPAPTATVGVLNTWVDVTGWTNMRGRGRAVKGSATANAMDVRAFIYASTSGGSTWEFRVVGTNTSAVSAAFTGVAAWRPGTASLVTGVAWAMDSSAVDTFKLQGRLTIGAGNLTVNGFDVIEDALNA